MDGWILELAKETAKPRISLGWAILSKNFNQQFITNTNS